VKALKRKDERKPMPPKAAILMSHAGMMPVTSLTTALNALLMGLTI